MRTIEALRLSALWLDGEKCYLGLKRIPPSPELCSVVNTLAFLFTAMANQLKDTEHEKD